MMDKYGSDFLTSIAEGTPDDLILDDDIIIMDAKEFADNLCGELSLICVLLLH